MSIFERSLATQRDLAQAAGILRNRPGVAMQRVHTLLVDLAGIRESHEAYLAPSPEDLWAVSEYLRDCALGLPSLHHALHRVAELLDARAMNQVEPKEHA